MPFKPKHLSKSTLLSISIAINVVSLLAISAFAVKAGSLSPSGSPAGTMYSLSDIYARLTTNATTTEGNHSLSSSASPASTMHTLKEIYEAIPAITANTVKLGTSYLGIAGTLTPDGGTATTADLFSGKTANLTNDWTLDSGELNLACNTATFNGTGNKVADTYDGSGNGSNRWCMTDSGNATASDISMGKVAWVNGVAVTGAASSGYAYGDNSAAKVLTTASGAGTYDASNLIASTVKSGTVFGAGLTGSLYGDTNQSKVLVSASAAGTALANLYGGTGQGFSQVNGGVDDYNAGNTAPSDRYNGGWTQCISSNHYCGTNDTGSAYRDESTGLVWSKTMNASTYALDNNNGDLSWFVANSCTELSGSTCTKKTSSKTGCEANVGWLLPTQKQLMMAYVDGSYGNLEPLGDYHLYWSGTTISGNITNAWGGNLSFGYTDYFSKTNTYRVRCVMFSLGN